MLLNVCMFYKQVYVIIEQYWTDREFIFYVFLCVSMCLLLFVFCYSFLRFLYFQSSNLAHSTDLDTAQMMATTRKPQTLENDCGLTSFQKNENRISKTKIQPSPTNSSTFANKQWNK
jgi:hypothetical protein